MHEERRRRRSEYAELALGYWLEAVAQRHQLLGLVLSDASGLLVSGTLESQQAHWLAALLPDMVEGEPVGAGGAEPSKRGRRVVRIEPHPMYLCGLGGGDACAAALEEATEGVQRIITQQLEGRHARSSEQN